MLRERGIAQLGGKSGRSIRVAGRRIIGVPRVCGRRSMPGAGPTGHCGRSKDRRVHATSGSDTAAPRSAHRRDLAAVWGDRSVGGQQQPACHPSLGARSRQRLRHRPPPARARGARRDGDVLHRDLRHGCRPHRRGEPADPSPGRRGHLALVPSSDCRREHPYHAMARCGTVPGALRGRFHGEMGVRPVEAGPGADDRIGGARRAAHDLPRRQSLRCRSGPGRRAARQAGDRGSPAHRHRQPPHLPGRGGPRRCHRPRRSTWCGQCRQRVPGASRARHSDPGRARDRPSRGRAPGSGTGQHRSGRHDGLPVSSGGGRW